MHKPYDAAAAGTAESITLYSQAIAAILNLVFYLFDWTSPTVSSTTLLGAVALPLTSMVQLFASISAYVLTAGVALMAITVSVQIIMALYTLLRPAIKIVEDERTQVDTTKTLLWWLRSLLAFVFCAPTCVELSESDPEVDFDGTEPDIAETRQHCQGLCVSKRRVFIWCCGCHCMCQRPNPDPTGNVLGFKTQGKVLARYLLSHHIAEQDVVNGEFIRKATAYAVANG
jgi:hypothetical protein